MKLGRLLISDDILKKILELFDKLSADPDYREIIGRDFTPACVNLLPKHIKNPAIIKPGIVI